MSVPLRQYFLLDMQDSGVFFRDSDGNGNYMTKVHAEIAAQYETLIGEKLGRAYLGVDMFTTSQKRGRFSAPVDKIVFVKLMFGATCQILPIDPIVEEEE